MRYLVKIDELKEEIDVLEERLSTIINQIENIQNLKNELIWDGPSKEAFIKQYNEYINNLQKISKRLIILISFLKSYYSNYSDEYMKLQSKYNRILANEVVL